MSSSLESDVETLDSDVFTEETGKKVDVWVTKYSTPDVCNSDANSASLKARPISPKALALSLTNFKDLPANFELLNQFGKAVDACLKSQVPGSLPKEMRSRVIRQIETTISCYNNKPSPETIDSIAKSLCEKYPPLQQLDPRLVMGSGDNQALNDDIPFKHWVCYFLVVVTTEF